MALTQARLKEVLHYDPETGISTWLPRLIREESARTDKSWNGRYAGKRAGSVSKFLGYRVMAIDDENYYEHRLAWFYMTGEWPDPQCDHENLDRADNRWANLREATISQQRMNRAASTKNTSGFKGVSYFKRDGNWKAQIQINGKNKHLGLFDTPEAAHAAYCAEADRLFGEFARAA